MTANNGFSGRLKEYSEAGRSDRPVNVKVTFFAKEP